MENVALNRSQKDTCLQDESWKRKTRIISLHLSRECARQATHIAASLCSLTMTMGVPHVLMGGGSQISASRHVCKSGVPNKEDPSHTRCAPVSPS